MDKQEHLDRHLELCRRVYERMKADGTWLWPASQKSGDVLEYEDQSKPCFGYIRVSIKEQADGASLDAQKDAITAFASQNNLLVTKWFEEQETASKAGRPLFEEMRQQLLRGLAEGVIIHRIDRSSRNFTDQAHIDELSKHGTKVFFAADGLDFESTGGRLMADIQMVLAAHYSRNLSFEVKKGLYGRIKQGQYPFRAPIGYLDNGEGQVKTVDPIKGPLVKLAFELYCSGEQPTRP